jgi:hypothetical protein
MHKNKNRSSVPCRQERINKQQYTDLVTNNYASVIKTDHDIFGYIIVREAIIFLICAKATRAFPFFFMIVTVLSGNHDLQKKQKMPLCVQFHRNQYPFQKIQVLGISALTIRLCSPIKSVYGVAQP